MENSDNNLDNYDFYSEEQVKERNLFRNYVSFQWKFILQSWPKEDYKSLIKDLQKGFGLESIDEFVNKVLFSEKRLENSSDPVLFQLAEFKTENKKAGELEYLEASFKFLPDVIKSSLKKIKLPSPTEKDIARFENEILSLNFLNEENKISEISNGFVNVFERDLSSIESSRILASKLELGKKLVENGVLKREELQLFTKVILSPSAELRFRFKARNERLLFYLVLRLFVFLEKPIKVDPLVDYVRQIEDSSNKKERHRLKQNLTKFISSFETDLNFFDRKYNEYYQILKRDFPSS